MTTTRQQRLDSNDAMTTAAENVGFVNRVQIDIACRQGSRLARSQVCGSSLDIPILK
jgi:hypothetical protein